MRNLFPRLKKDKTVYKILSCKRRDNTLVNEVFIRFNKVGGEQLSTVLSLLESVVWWA